MNKFLKKILGIDKIEAEAAEAARVRLLAEAEKEEALKKASNAKKLAKKAEEDRQAAEAETKAALEKNKLDKEEAERIASLSPKELANEKKEPYFKVLDLNINRENPKFGYFELDWNEQHVVYCKSLGYFGETEESIVDSWFTDYCKMIASQEGVNMDRRGTGFINVKNIGNGQSEIS